MDEKERAELRLFYMREYYIKTGKRIVCRELDMYTTQAKATCIENIVELAARYVKESVETITSKSRKAHLVEIRRMIMAVLVEYKVEHKRIATALGGKDRTTIIHSMREHTKIISVDKFYRTEYKAFKEYVKYEITEIGK